MNIIRAVATRPHRKAILAILSMVLALFTAALTCAEIERRTEAIDPMYQEDEIDVMIDHGATLQAQETATAKAKSFVEPPPDEEEDPPLPDQPAEIEVEQNPPPQGAPLPDPSSPPIPPVIAGECDPRSAPIQTDLQYFENIEPTQDEYPANCTYYCLWIPHGMGALDILISNLSSDLDLFAVYGEFSSIIDIEAAAADWMSYTEGLVDESISISNPEADEAYYIEVCAYHGEQGGSFNLEASVH